MPGRVLMVNCDPPSGSAGGAERFAFGLARELSSTWDVSTLSSANGLRRWRGRVGRKLLFDMWGGNRGRFEDVVKEVNPDLVHFHNVYGIGSDLIARSKRLRPTVVTAHDYWPFCFTSTMTRNGKGCDGHCSRCYFPIGPLMKWVRHRHLEGVTIISPSRFLARRMEEAGFHARHIDNAVDPSPVYPTRTDRLLFIGRMVWEKGADMAVEAALRCSIPIDLVGDGPGVDTLRRYEGEGVRFHGYLDDLETELSRGGIVVVPSRWPENQPLVPMEALSRGMPVVAADTGGMGEIVENGVNGRLFPPGDIDALCKVVMETIDDPIDVDVGAFRERFSWKRTADAYMEAYREAL